MAVTALLEYLFISIEIEQVMIATSCLQLDH